MSQLLLEYSGLFPTVCSRCLFKVQVWEKPAIVGIEFEGLNELDEEAFEGGR